MKQGWEIKKLGEVVDVLDNLRKPITKRDRIEGEFPYYGATGVLSYVHNYIFSEKLVLIGEDGAKWASGDNTSFTADGKYWVNNHAHVIRPNRKIIIDEWIVYFLNFSDLTPFITGMTVPKLNQEKMRSIPIPLPPFPEQQRIVAILDDAFAKIEKAKANAEQNLKNAKELFESYLQGVFENKGDDWEEKTLGEIGKPSMCKRILKNQTSSRGDVPFYKIGTFGKTPDAYISQEIYNEYRTKFSFPKKGDVLISASGTIGRRVRYNGEPAFFQDSNIVWIDNDEKQVLNDYLYVFYEFCDWQPSKGATISRLYNNNLTSIKIVFPKSFKEQVNLIEKINTLSTKTKQLEVNYKQKLADLKGLKKSILNTAFNGEL